MYFAWGETQGYAGDAGRNFSFSNYKLCSNGSYKKITKYTFEDGEKDCSWYNGDDFIGDGKTILDPEDDAAAAHVNMGGEWRMPTKDEADELYANCFTEWTDDYNGTGVAGIIIKSKINSNYIFLPAAGFIENGTVSMDGNTACFWCSTLADLSWNACCFDFNDWGNFRNFTYLRSNGYSIRAVCE